MELSAALKAAEKAGVDPKALKPLEDLAKASAKAHPDEAALAKMRKDIAREGDDAPVFFIANYARLRESVLKAQGPGQKKLDAELKTVEALAKIEKDAKRKKALADVMTALKGRENSADFDKAYPPPEKFNKEYKRLLKEANGKKDKKAAKSATRKVKIGEDHPGKDFLNAKASYQEQAPDLPLTKLDKHKAKFEMLDKAVKSFNDKYKGKLVSYQNFLRKPDKEESENGKKAKAFALQLDTFIDKADGLLHALKAAERDVKAVKGKTQVEQKVTTLLQEDFETVLEVLEEVVSSRNPDVGKAGASAAGNVDEAIKRHAAKAAKPAKAN